MLVYELVRLEGDTVENSCPLDNRFACRMIFLSNHNERMIFIELLFSFIIFNITLFRFLFKKQRRIVLQNLIYKIIFLFVEIHF